MNRQKASVTNVACSCCAELLRTGLGRRRFLTLAGGTGIVMGMPSLVRAASGSYEALLLTCIDPRFPVATLDYMRGKGLTGQYSQFAFAGAAIGAIEDKFKAWRQTFWENVEVSAKLHKINRVIAMDHRQCGAAEEAYGPDVLKSRAEETRLHFGTLRRFRTEVELRTFDGRRLSVATGLMDLDGSVQHLAFRFQTGDEIALQADTGLYLCRLDKGGRGTADAIEAVRKAIEPGGRFRVVVLASDKIALVADNDCYLSPVNNTATIAATKRALEPDCAFNMTASPEDGKITLLASNGRYLSRIQYDPQTQPIEAVKQSVDPNSRFAVVSPRWSLA